MRFFSTNQAFQRAWIAGLLGLVLFSAAAVRAERLDHIFAAIRLVETGGESDPAAAVGDGGRSFGPYQISRKYWLDAGALCDWEDVKKEGVAEKVMLAYWKRYCPAALERGDAMVLARIHNGGPNGLKKMTATEHYWRRVLTELNHLKARAAVAEARGLATKLASSR
ncbi:hypothetical protein LBMAG56_50550 [Verrucomicrobiota bacterium]|nr:hypothetical protein LBMAG56_50550 [Verrucomicrobiota bacterium]